MRKINYSIKWDFTDVKSYLSNRHILKVRVIKQKKIITIIFLGHEILC